MSATTNANETSQSAAEYTADNISEVLDIQSSPADALAALDGWGELRTGIEENRDWADIDGVGPATENALNSADVDTLPVESPPSPEVEPDTSPDGDDGGEEGSEDDEASGGDGDPSDAGVDDSDEEESAADEAEEVDSSEDGGASDAGGEGDEAEDEEEGLFELSHSPSVFEATIELSRLKEVFSTVSCLVDETKLRVDDDRIAIRAVDPANVGMVDLDMHARAFDSYQATRGVLGINVDRVIDVLSVGKSDDIVSLELNTDTRKLNIAVDGLEYTIALIDPDSIRQEPDLPDLNLTTTLEMESKVLSQAVDAGDMVSDHLGIGFEPGGPGMREEDYAEFYARGDTDDVDFDLTARDDVNTIDVMESGESLFSLDYLGNIDKMVPKGETLELEVGDEFPTKIFFNVADSHAAVETMLAPRIQSD